jgi:O-antigen ligase
MMAAGGGRGPLLCLGATFSVATVLILVKKIRGHSMLPAKRIATLSFFLVVGGLAVATAVVDLRHMQTIRRIETLLTEQSGGGSARIRLAHYHRAWEYWQLSPLVGHGIGSYPTLRLGFDTRDYPHNIILELMVETGLVGLTMFFLLLFSGFKSYRAVLAKPTSFGIGAFLMTVFFLLFSQFSGDITDNRFLFMSLGFFSGTGSNHHASTAE